MIVQIEVIRFPPNVIAADFLEDASELWEHFPAAFVALVEDDLPKAPFDAVHVRVAPDEARREVDVRPADLALFSVQDVHSGRLEQSLLQSEASAEERDLGHDPKQKQNRQEDWEDQDHKLKAYERDDPDLEVTSDFDEVHDNGEFWFGKRSFCADLWC